MDERTEILHIIGSNEPDYSKALSFGKEAVPVLVDLINDGPPLLAAKAAYFASLIPQGQGARVLQVGLKAPAGEVRAAAAAGLKNIKITDNIGLMKQALGDPDPDVRKAAVYSLRHAEANVAKSELGRFVHAEPLGYLREIAQKLLQEVE